MFFVRRAVLDIGRKSVGNNFRLYCKPAKRAKLFEKPIAPAAVDESFSNINKDKKLNENDTNNERENENEKSQQEQQHEREQERQSDRDLQIRGQFNQVTVKNRDTFVSMVRMFVERDKYRRHHVEFIYAALKHMEEFGVERDLEVYKEILNVMPKGKMIPTNMLQAEFMHYPKQQDCAVFLLDQMEYNGLFTECLPFVLLSNMNSLM